MTAENTFASVETCEQHQNAKIESCVKSALWQENGDDVCSQEKKLLTVHNRDRLLIQYKIKMSSMAGIK